MRRSYHRRLLAYEQLESKAAPSSILMVISGDGPDTEIAADAANLIATHSSQASDCRYETNQVLRFVAQNTGGERAHRAATLWTDTQCAAADEMMKLNPTAWNSLLVLGFYDDGTEL